MNAPFFEDADDIDACAAPGWGLSVIDEFVSLVNPVLFEPPFPPEGSRPCGAFRPYGTRELTT